MNKDISRKPFSHAGPVVVFSEIQNFMLWTCSKISVHGNVTSNNAVIYHAVIKEYGCHT